MTRGITLLLILIGLAGAGHCQEAQPVNQDEQPPPQEDQLFDAKQRIKDARSIWQLFLKYEGKNDPKLMDLYSDEALITQTKYVSHEGTPIVMKMKGSNFKPFFRKIMEKRPLRNQECNYRGVEPEVAGDKVRFRATMYCEKPLRYSAPFELIVGIERGPKWVIFEEKREIRYPLPPIKKR